MYPEEYKKSSEQNYFPGNEDLPPEESPGIGNMFPEKSEEIIELAVLGKVQSFNNTLWRYDAGILEASVGGSKQKFLQIPVIPDGKCLYHALGIDPDAKFFQKLVEEILKISHGKERWSTLLALIKNELQNLPNVKGIALESYKDAVKNNFIGNLELKRQFPQNFAEEIVSVLKNTDDVDKRMKYTLNMKDKHIKSILEKILEKKIETFTLEKKSNPITFQHKDSFKIILFNQHWCPIFNTDTQIPKRYLKKTTWETLRNFKRSLPKPEVK